MFFIWLGSLSDSRLEELSQFCYGITIEKGNIIEVNGQGQRIGVTDLVQRARTFGLKIHTWTTRNEDRYLIWEYGQDPYLEYEDLVMNALVDGVITDFPATVTRYLDNLYTGCGWKGNIVTQNVFLCVLLRNKVFTWFLIWICKLERHIEGLTWLVSFHYGLMRETLKLWLYFFFDYALIRATNLRDNLFHYALIRDTLKVFMSLWTLIRYIKVLIWFFLLLCTHKRHKEIVPLCVRTVFIFFTLLNL